MGRSHMKTKLEEASIETIIDSLESHRIASARIEAEVARRTVAHNALIVQELHQQIQTAASGAIDLFLERLIALDPDTLHSLARTVIEQAKTEALHECADATQYADDKAYQVLEEVKSLKAKIALLERQGKSLGNDLSNNAKRYEEAREVLRTRLELAEAVCKAVALYPNDKQRDEVKSAMERWRKRVF